MDWLREKLRVFPMIFPHPINRGFPWFPCMFSRKKCTHSDSNDIFPQTNLNPNAGEGTRAKAKMHSWMFCWLELLTKKLGIQSAIQRQLIHWTMLGHCLKRRLQGQMALHWANDICWQFFQHSLSLLKSQQDGVPELSWLTTCAPGLRADVHIHENVANGGYKWAIMGNPYLFD